jgi:hypothetical protein
MARVEPQPGQWNPVTIRHGQDGRNQAVAGSTKNSPAAASNPSTPAEIQKSRFRE